jgi:hypothetical protein
MNAAEKVIPGPSWATEVLELIEKGESYFSKAAIIMQRQIDQGMTQRQVAKVLGKSVGWVNAHLQWQKKAAFSGTEQKTPFSGQGPKKRSGRGRKRPAEHHAAAAKCLDEGKTREQVAVETGLSEHQVQLSREREIGRREMLAELLAAAAAQNFSDKGKLTIENAIRIHRRNLDVEYDTRRSKEIREHIQRIMPTLQQERNQAFKTEQFYREFMQKQKKIMTTDEFRLVLSCLHPDYRDSVTKERLNRAFLLFEPKKFAITGEK